MDVKGGGPRVEHLSAYELMREAKELGDRLGLTQPKMVTLAARHGVEGLSQPLLSEWFTAVRHRNEQRDVLDSKRPTLEGLVVLLYELERQAETGPRDPSVVLPEIRARLDEIEEWVRLQEPTPAPGAGGGEALREKADMMKPTDNDDRRGRDTEDG